MSTHSIYKTDVLIIGAGAAGLSIAIRLAAHLHVTLVLKGDLPGGASYWAQGGIAVALHQEDNPQIHTEDTITVGAGLCHQKVVEFVTKQACSQLEWLLAQNVHFSEESNGPYHLHLTREGGHSFRRIVHTNDATGAAIQTRLAEIAKQLPNLTILPHRIAIDLLLTHKKNNSDVIHQPICTGAYLYNEAQHSLEIWKSDTVVLATGGASGAWLHSTNPDVASGDGIAIAWRAGCRIANLEFNQFHPTCLFTSVSNEQSRSFLLTEALRGEGAYLTLPNHTRFMPAYHSAAELAPRDVVARAIDNEIKKHKLDYVYLDISHRPAEFVRNHFPTIYTHCLELGIDITSDRIPVIPAAHYTCGGIITDLNGTTDIPKLYAIGEVACTGLHGGNRIASNSLLECFVFSEAAAQHILRQPTTKNMHLNNKTMQQEEIQHPIYTAHLQRSAIINNIYQLPDAMTGMLNTLRNTMSDKVGIIRNEKGLYAAQKIIDQIKQTANQIFPILPINRTSLEFSNLLQVSELIIRSALLRKESRGLHFMEDYPNPDDTQAHDTILTPYNYHSSSPQLTKIEY